jgi:hypothetical protein
MIYLDDNTINNIENTIKNVVKAKLLNGFQNRKSQPVVSVEQININYDINTEKSNRNVITLGPVIINTRVFVNLKDNIGQATNWLTLRINFIEFLYDDNSNNFILGDNQELTIIDMSN